MLDIGTCNIQYCEMSYIKIKVKKWKIKSKLKIKASFLQHIEVF